MENVPVSVSHHGGRQPHNTTQKSSKKSLTRFKLAIISAVVVVVLAVFVLGALNWVRQGSAAMIDSSKYQAVFLSSGQVYFGKLEMTNTEYMRLTEVFYLQTKADAATSENPQTANTDANDVELIKLGGEIHGPEDEMLISKEQVLFFENLKPDGRVSQSITNFTKQ